jgi:hypothetical protein
MKAETAVTREVIEAVNATGAAFVWRNQSGITKVRGGFMHLAPEGSPDVVGWLRGGRFLGIEVKVEGNRTQKARAERQREWRDRIVASGGVSGEVRSAADAVALVLRAIGAGP